MLKRDNTQSRSTMKRLFKALVGEKFRRNTC